ncbi:hypothetical protein V1264_015667 [Littorina saxatilis]|uniref:protein-tyrosine-phosphatase n=1 Tax=Littorina saxatilis TaxID=31220 RepID=A0AAN9BK62_9CAEN
MHSSRVSTINSSDTHPIHQNDPSQSSDHADKSRGDVYAVVKPKSKRAKYVMYENVTVNGSPKLSQESNAASSSTTVEQNGAMKTNTTHEREGKPPVAPKPTQGRLSRAGTKTPHEHSPNDEEDFKMSDLIYANEELHVNINPTGIRVDKLQQTVVNKLRDGSLEEEFMRILPTKAFTLKNGGRKENYHKNRYKSLLPYDKNRVELEQVDGDDSSDYVSASFVRVSVLSAPVARATSADVVVIVVYIAVAIRVFIVAILTRAIIIVAVVVCIVL